MPRLSIDQRSIEVEPGTKVIEAAERLGIMIPRFCYHPALGPVGACRLCAVMFLKGPVKGLQMSCMIDAQDEMVVSTTHIRAVLFRKHIIEWLMMNHPHDCPVCDEGGHCLLQDHTVSGGHSIRRFPGQKRTYRDQYLGPLVQHEMNRCIQCYRCSRFYREFAGYRDLGTLQIASSLYFGRYCDGRLESPFSGNLIDICPTGVYTDKPSRYKARRWDLDRGDSICIHCSLGCNTKPGARYRSVVRIESGTNQMVNGYFICDRGRYGFEHSGLENRPREPMADGKICGLEEAVSSAASRIKEIKSQYGPESVACIGSLRCSLESMAALKNLSRLSSWRPPHFFFNKKAKLAVINAVNQLDQDLAISLDQLGSADFMLVIGCDPVNEAPMLALSMRQAVRAGAQAVVIDPRPVELPFEFHHLMVSRQNMHKCLAALVKRAFAREDLPPYEELQEFYRALPGQDPLNLAADELNGLASALAKSKNPAVITGPEVIYDSTPLLAGGCSRLFNKLGRTGGFFPVLSGANAFSAALLDDQREGSFEDLLKALEEEEIKALVVVESDPLGTYFDQRRLEKALDKLSTLVVMDYLPSNTMSKAQIFLPVRNVFETGSSFINQEGRLQYAAKIHEGGTAIYQISGGGHPPRQFSREIPGGMHRDSWQLLQLLGKELGTFKSSSVHNPWQLVAEEVPLLGGLDHLNYPYREIKLSGLQRDSGFKRMSFALEEKEPQELDVLLVDLTFGTEELSTYGPTLSELTPEPYVILSAQDAHERGLKDGDLVRVQLQNAQARGILRISKKTAPGTLIIPKLSGSGWQEAGDFQLTVPAERITKEGSNTGGRKK